MLMGKTLFTKLALDASWILNRLAHETATQIFGNEFNNNAHALSEELLLSWITPQDSVVDVGCGTGRWAFCMAKKAKSVLGVDYDPLSIQAAKDQNSKAEFRLMDVTQSLAELGTFDVALLSHVLEHVDDPVSLLQTIRKNSKRIIVEVPDQESNSLNWVRIRLDRNYYSDADHVREYTYHLLEQQLEAADWRIDNSFGKGGAIVVMAT